jgi:hypothetical protein
VLGFTLAGVKDQFMINYGSGGIGSEIIANRLHTGPMHDCTDCAYEEFFLSSSTVGDPALLVNFPANTGIEQCDPTNILDDSCWRIPAVDNDGDGIPDTGGANGPVRFINPTTDDVDVADNYALYQADPYNVHHAYLGDATKIRNTHAGSFEQHIFHLHNQQWQFNPSDDNANYLDAQEIMPGSGHTYELINGGAGNRNKTVGDAIFHCHFYPHFAQGMWYHVRIKDVMETGTVLAVSGVDADGNPGFHPAKDPITGKTAWGLRSGKPAVGARALPDGELPDGVPIPAIVPLPGKAMPPMPAKVRVAAVDRGEHTIFDGRKGPDGIPDSSQAFVDRTSVAGPDGELGSADDVSPGYPFWLAANECGPDQVIEDADGNLLPLKDRKCPQGTVGQRMPTPPLDMLSEAGAIALKAQSGDTGMWKDVHPAQAGGWDGGLPRHSLLGYVSGGLSKDTQNRLDFRKVIEMSPPVYFPEIGTDLEQVAMRTHMVRERQSAANKLAGGIVQTDTFTMNGAPPVPGGPFQDPCIDDKGARLLKDKVGDWFDGDGNPETFNTKGGSEFHSQNPRTYRIANIQIDAVFNKVGYHYPQERIIALWGDVEPTINKQRPPEPLVMRFNTFDCGKLLHANLVPHEYELDDFQVRTPTDIIGQHIHLPKWDLTTNDGAANGWNYEDGALAPGIVKERVIAINHFNEYAGTVVGPNCTAKAGLAGDKTKCPLPGQLAPIDLTGFAPVSTIDTGDPASNLGAEICIDQDGISDNGNEHCYIEMTAAKHPFFANAPGNPQTDLYLGARTVIQRILVDPVVNVAGVDRGLGLTFSHDHYGPSTFQQIGLYSTILAEPAGSTWVHNESGEDLYGRQVDDPTCTVNCTDGGPTSWQAAILPPAGPKNGSNVKSELIKDHREFYFEMSDFQHAYEPQEAADYVGADPDGIPKLTQIIQPDPFDVTQAKAPALKDSWRQAVNPPLKLKSVPFPDVVTAENACPGPAGNYDPNIPRPCVEAINISHSSMFVVNYRNEPVGLRVFDPDKKGPDGQDGAQADGDKGDLAFALQTRTDREIPQLNTSLGNTPYPTPSYCASSTNGDGINCDRRPGDPFTPIMRAHEFDEVKIKVQVGATEEQHQTTFHGLKWLSNGSGFGRSPNSGWRNFQSHGISEQFSLQMPIIPDRQNVGNETDYLYAQDATRDGFWTGTWGLIRNYANKQKDLFELPDNPVNGDIKIVDENNFSGVCPKFEMDANGVPIKVGKGKNAKYIDVPVRQFDVAAVLANKVLQKPVGVVIPPFNSKDPLFAGFVDENGNPAQPTYAQETVGGPLDTNGGTLVYNRREGPAGGIDTCQGGHFDENGNCTGTLRNVKGALHDPTAMMYVRLEDLEPRYLTGPDGKKGTADDISPDILPLATGGDGVDDRCQKFKEDGWDPTLKNPECPVQLKSKAPVEPLVLRANAGDCIEITLHNKLIDQATANSSPVWYEDNGVMKSLFEKVEYDKLVLQGKTFQTSDGKVVKGDADDAENPGDITFDRIPDLAGWQDAMWVVNRHMMDGNGIFIEPDARRAGGQEMHFFNNNLIRPSAQAGLHAQLVEYDMSKDDGVVAGINRQSTVAGPRAQHTYRYYAGHIDTVSDGTETVTKGKNKGTTTRNFRRRATPVEFGGTNLLSADRVKQPQKGLYGALVIEPKGATYPDAHDHLWDVADNQGTGAETRKTRAQVTVKAPQIELDENGDPIDIPFGQGIAGDGGEYDEAISIAFRITNPRWRDGTAIANIHQGELGREGAEDSGHAGFNYGMEPSWFRFGLAPDAPFGNAGTPNSFGSIPNVHAFYANGLVKDEMNAVPDNGAISAAGDPATPVFRQRAGMPGRMHLLNGASADRDATFILHGHVWQRAPFVCPDDNEYGLTGYCNNWRVAPEKDEYGVDIAGTGVISSLGSLALGLNPVGKYMGGEEGMGHAYSHWPILYNTGGTNGVKGDYLFRDYAPSGARNGMYGILRACSDLETCAAPTGGGN